MQIPTAGEQIRADWDRDRWFSATEARDYGIVDHVLSTRADLAAMAADPRSVG